MSLIIPEKLPDSIDSAVSNVSAPLTKSIGKTLDSLFDLAFGWINDADTKAKIKRQLELDQFEKRAREKCAAIPEDCRKEPDLQIAGQTIQKSIYCLTHEELQELFANLLASSIDSRKQSSVQPCFADILSQMTPLDAQNIQLFNSNRSLPLVNITASFESQIKGNYVIVFRNAFLSNKVQNDLNKQSISISSLERFGLIRTDYLVSLSDKSLYSEIENSEVFKQRRNDIADLLASNEEYRDAQIETEHGCATLTPLGVAFLNAVTPYDPDETGPLFA